MTDELPQSDSDYTVPPLRRLRFDTPHELFAQMPQVADFSKHRPYEGEDNFAYLDRQRSSTTPEDAITFAAFATTPRFGIYWGLQSIRSILPQAQPEDVEIFKSVAQWLASPEEGNRWLALRNSMFATHRSPAVYLGLAVGWSGGIVAPNDPSTPPPWRSPRAVNAAVLTAIARGGLDKRSVHLARTIELASGFFRLG